MFKLIVLTVILTFTWPRSAIFQSILIKVIFNFALKSVLYKTEKAKVSLVTITEEEFGQY